MPRKKQPQPDDDHRQQLTFEDVMKQAEVLSREDLSAKIHPQEIYDPIEKTADYMRRAVQVEHSWETTMRQAREELQHIDARELYFSFCQDMARKIEENSPRSNVFATLLDAVAYRGLGMSRKQIEISRPTKGGTRWRIFFADDLVKAHLQKMIVGSYFLNPIQKQNALWKNEVAYIGASDVSQHRSAVPVPARFFKRSVPFVLNNAAGAICTLRDGVLRYENLFNPKPNDELLRWMLLDPSYQDELEPEDYERCIASAMDVGQYKFDYDYLMNHDKHFPDIIFRDGTIFPQDAFLDNYVIDSRRGEFTREALRSLLSCLLEARTLGIIYCGVSKNVQLKVYSAVVDWYIETHIQSDWGIGNYTLNDGQAMSLLLSTPAFVADNLQQVLATCLIRRPFTTRAMLNNKTDLDKIDEYFDHFQAQNPDMDITPYRSLCGIAHLYMFFMGHSKSPQQQLPRYEFFHSEGDPLEIAAKLLTALSYCGLTNDDDHSFMADKKVTYLIPSITQQAHTLSKDVGQHIDSATGQWIMARFQQHLPLK